MTLNEVGKDGVHLSGKGIQCYVCIIQIVAICFDKYFFIDKLGKKFLELVQHR